MTPVRTIGTGLVAGLTAKALLLAVLGGTSLLGAAIVASEPASAQSANAAPTASSAQGQPRARVRVQKSQPAAWPHPRPGEYSYPGPGAVRQCEAWYATEHRPSGTVVTPQQRCRWVRN